MRAIVYRAVHSGLANRLRALVGYQAMAGISGIPFYLYWRPNWACDVKFDDLFDIPSIQLIDRRTLESLQQDPEILITNKNLWCNDIWKTYLSSDRDYDSYMQAVSKSTESLQPRKEISSIIDKFMSEHDLDKCHGIHIRMTDNVEYGATFAARSSHFDQSRFSTLAGFTRYIEDTLADDKTAQFYLATDNEMIEEQLLAKYPGHIIIYKKQFNSLKKFNLFRLSYSHTRSTSVQNALVEMILLSRCRPIVGTYFSSYSKFAAYWGGKDYIEIQGDHYTPPMRVPFQLS